MFYGLIAARMQIRGSSHSGHNEESEMLLIMVQPRNAEQYKSKVKRPGRALFWPFSRPWPFQRRSSKLRALLGAIIRALTTESSMAGHKLEVLKAQHNSQLILSPSRSLGGAIRSFAVLCGISLHLDVAVAQLFDCQSLHRWLLAIQVTCFLFCPLIGSIAAAPQILYAAAAAAATVTAAQLHFCRVDETKVKRANHVWQLLITGVAWLFGNANR